MTKKAIRLTLEQAQAIYKGADDMMKALLETTFSKEELEGEWDSWDDIPFIDGHYPYLNVDPDFMFAHEYQARNVRYAAKLSQLMNQECYRRKKRQGDTKDYGIVVSNRGAILVGSTANKTFLSFDTNEQAARFAEKHRALITHYFNTL